MRVSKIGIVVIGLVPFNVYAVPCTPAPDCDAIGYTETSCETISLKCPFDQTKLYCFPCDSSYQYTCDAINEYGSGESCKGKYKSCCNTNCIVGAIYYSDGSCNTCLDSTKTAVGVIVKDNEIIATLTIPDMSWSAGYLDVSGLNNIESVTDAQNDLDGQSNTSAIIEQYGDDADSSKNAGIYCNAYSPESMSMSKGHWYLPSAGEIYQYFVPHYSLLINSWTLTGTKLVDIYLWSSTESGLYGAWIVDIENGELIQSSGTKHYNHSVVCLLRLTSIQPLLEEQSN